MKILLFDHNLSPRLVDRLTDLYPNSIHVESVDLGTALDQTVWEFARRNDFIIVTKDVDFGELSILRGFPPKVLWIRRGNCSTSDIENILRANHETIAIFSDDAETGILTLF